jgi:hypothetical protein
MVPFEDQAIPTRGLEHPFPWLGIDWGDKGHKSGAARRNARVGAGAYAAQEGLERHNGQ